MDLPGNTGEMLARALRRRFGGAGLLILFAIACTVAAFLFGTGAV